MTKHNQLSLFDVDKFSRNYQALNCSNIEKIDFGKLEGLHPRELKPVARRFNLQVHGNSSQILNRIKRASRKHLEKRILG